MNSYVYPVIMLLAGVGIPIMAALNAGLGAKLQDPVAAAFILFIVALLASTAYLLVFRGVPSSLYLPGTPLHFYLGGLFVVFYVLSVTWVAPRFGVGNAVAFVLLGQLISIATIDQFGLMGAQVYALTPQRLLGLLLMAAGVFLVVRK